MTAPVHIVGDGFDTTRKFMAAAVPTPDVMLRIREKTVSFSKLLQSLEDDFLSDLAERWKKTDGPIA